MENKNLLDLTANIVVSHVGANKVDPDGLVTLINGVHAALCSLGSAPSEDAIVKPAVPISRSVKRDYIVCLEDGKKLKMLKRYLRTNFDMSPAEYREKWGLASDYPMVAPAYAEMRRDMAKRIGLGKAANQKRGRRKKT
ncbi:transcriptional regulator [Erythrobacter sp. HI00D59]|nr:transcriptional regulator [Erythrobacter sp. HI00D59]